MVLVATRDELVVALAARYASSSRKERGQILDEFAAVSGLHRKHAMRLLRAGRFDRRSGPRPGRRLYDDAVREAPIVIWEASDRICGKRPRPLVPILAEAMERHGHLRPAPEVRTGLLAMSAATIDRVLRDVRDAAGVRKRRNAPPSAAIRRSVPVRTFADWNDPPPGFVEADLVAHCGPSAKGSYVQTLTLTDIATGWTECAPVLVREQRLLTEVLSTMRQRMPFALLGFDTDNDSVFMNETVKTYCEEAGLVLTRCRPYRKNDQAWVEQKNGAVVRRAVGYLHYEGLEAAAALARLYTSLRLFVNFFQPSFKLAGKARDGAKIKKTIPSAGHAVSASAGGHASERGGAEPGERDFCEPGSGSSAARDSLDPGTSRRNRRPSGHGRSGPSERADHRAIPLRVAHRVADGEARPTDKPKAKALRGRRRPDPFVAVTAMVREWFEAEPWRTTRELFERLQGERPGVVPDGQLRTLQRRMKEWRRERARELVFGNAVVEETLAKDSALRNI